MFNGIHFYHETIRRSVAVFGTLFNDITILRTDNAGTVKNITKVPLSYGPKKKFLARIDQQADLNDPKIAIKLPRMSFELTSLSYDPNTKMQKGTKQTLTNTSSSTYTKKRILGPVGYRMGIQLNIMSKNQDDALQIIEQILPFFQPDYTVTVKQVNDSIKTDMPFVLNGVGIADDYEGDFNTRRTIVYTLDFETRVRFYGEVSNGAVIRKTVTDFIDSTSNQVFEKQIVMLNPFLTGPDEEHTVNVKTNLGNVPETISLAVSTVSLFNVGDIIVGTTTASVGQITQINSNTLLVSSPSELFVAGETITIQNTVVTDVLTSVTENW